MDRENTADALSETEYRLALNYVRSLERMDYTRIVVPCDDSCEVWDTNSPVVRNTNPYKTVLATDLLFRVARERDEFLVELASTKREIEYYRRRADFFRGSVSDILRNVSSWLTKRQSRRIRKWLRVSNKDMTL